MQQDDSHEKEVLSQFTRQAEGYAKLVGELRDSQPQPAFAAIRPVADDVALDVACGPGSMTLQIARHARHVSGIDITPAMIAQARAAQAAQGITNVDWQVGDIYRLPHADLGFSLVLCSAAFHHLERPGDVLREMRRVCRKDGRIAVVDLAPAPEKMAAFDALERMRDPSHVHALSVPEFRALAEECGLTEARLERYEATVPLDAVLATSHPTDCTIGEIRSRLADDARAATDSFGFKPRFQGDTLFVAYPMAAFVWTR